MGKTFDEHEITEMKNKFTEFCAANPQFRIDADEAAADFAEIVKKTVYKEGEEHKAPEYRRIKEIASDDKTLTNYKNFYTNLLKNQFKEIGIRSVRKLNPVFNQYENYTADRNVKIPEDTYKNYENFMRGMFEEYVKPYLVLDATLKDYRYGRMGADELKDVSSALDDCTALQVYRTEKVNDRRNERDFSDFDYLDDMMNVHSLTGKRILTDEELASSAAVMYKEASRAYDQRSWFSKWFFTKWLYPDVYREQQTLSRAKNYIRTLHPDDTANKAGFNNYVNSCCSISGIDAFELHKTMKDIQSYIEDSEDLKKTDPDADLMNAPKQGNIMKDLYGDNPEEPDEVMEDFDIINTNVQERTSELVMDAA